MSSNQPGLSRVDRKRLSHRELARTALAEANRPADADTLNLAAMGIGYAILELADAVRDRNHALIDALRGYDE